MGILAQADKYTVTLNKKQEKEAPPYVPPKKHKKPETNLPQLNLVPEETKLVIDAPKRRVDAPKPTVTPQPMEESTKVQLDGVDYDSIDLAIEATGLPRSTVKKHLEDGKAWKDNAGIEHLITPI